MITPPITASMITPPEGGPFFEASTGLKDFFLFHHDPSHDDSKITKLVEDARALAKRLGGNLKIDAAREGLEVVLKARAAVR